MRIATTLNEAVIDVAGSSAAEYEVVKGDYTDIVDYANNVPDARCIQDALAASTDTCLYVVRDSFLFTIGLVAVDRVNKKVSWVRCD